MLPELEKLLLYKCHLLLGLHFLLMTKSLSGEGGEQRSQDVN